MDSVPSQRYGNTAAPPQWSNPLWLTQKTLCRFHVRGKRWKGIESKLPFKHLYCSASWDLSKLWKVSSGLRSAEETDPIGAGTALRSGGINFILKMLLLERNIYSMTTRPHHESRLLAIISWLRAPKIQTSLTPGKARWESWHAGSWVTLWWMCKWWNTEAPWPPNKQCRRPSGAQNVLHLPPPALEKCRHDVAKTAESAAHCSIKSCLLHQRWQLHVRY